MGAVICAKCALLGPTCCRLGTGSKNFQFPLSEEEKTRIEKHMGMDPEQFTSEAANEEGFVSQLRQLFPDDRGTVSRLFPLQGSHEQLDVDDTGKCVFLEPDGCRLPREIRPFYCVLFPFWVANQKVVLFYYEQCQAQKESSEIRAVMEALNMNGEQILRLHALLKEAWGINED